MQRKGAKSKQEILPEILTQLNAGEIVSANLVEWLAVDQLILLKVVLEKANRIHNFKSIQQQVEQIKTLSVNQTAKSIGIGLQQACTTLSDQMWLTQQLAYHPSDTVRGWVCYAIANNPELNLQEKFRKIYTLAQDPHFGVREVAWMAMRPFIIDELDLSLSILVEWANDQNPYIRRFASEAIRPRGVWCAHILVLRNNPKLALPILDQLMQDEHRYVQDSVGNWLNDASKTQPDFVKEYCQKWENVENVATQYIIKKALRSLNKK